MASSSLRLLQSPAASLSSELPQTNNLNHPPHSVLCLHFPVVRSYTEVLDFTMKKELPDIKSR